jgi:hypothetical protein
MKKYFTLCVCIVLIKLPVFATPNAYPNKWDDKAIFSILNATKGDLFHINGFVLKIMRAPAYSDGKPTLAWHSNQWLCSLNKKPCTIDFKNIQISKKGTNIQYTFDLGATKSTVFAKIMHAPLSVQVPDIVKKNAKVPDIVKKNAKVPDIVKKKSLKKDKTLAAQKSSTTDALNSKFGLNGDALANAMGMQKSIVLAIASNPALYPKVFTEDGTYELLNTSVGNFFNIGGVLLEVVQPAHYSGPNPQDNSRKGTESFNTTFFRAHGKWICRTAFGIICRVNLKNTKVSGTMPNLTYTFDLGNKVTAVIGVRVVNYGKNNVIPDPEKFAQIFGRKSSDTKDIPNPQNFPEQAILALLNTSSSINSYVIINAGLFNVVQSAILPKGVHISYDKGKLQCTYQKSPCSIQPEESVMAEQRNDFYVYTFYVRDAKQRIIGPVQIRAQLL